MTDPGRLPPALATVHNRTGRAERVLTPQEAATMALTPPPRAAGDQPEQTPTGFVNIGAVMVPVPPVAGGGAVQVPVYVADPDAVAEDVAQPTAGVAAQHAARVLLLAEATTTTILDMESRARVLDIIAGSWASLAVAIAEHRAMQPLPADSDD